MSRLLPVTFPKLSLLLLCALSAPAWAQNGSNYHVLTNGLEGALFGVGAGGAQTGDDGIGTWVPGEDLRGSLIADPDGGGPMEPQFSYRNVSLSESICLFAPGTSGAIQIRFPGIYLFELDGLNPNQPPIFTRPVCAPPLSASFVPYGVGPSSTVSFVTEQFTAFGPLQNVLLPDNGLVAGTGTATLVAGVSANLPPVITSASGSLPPGCYVVQFGWAPSALALADGIDGLWHYAVNSDDGNQYWQMSTDEMNVWQSNTVVTDGGYTAIVPFLSVVDYGLLLASSEANTHAVLAPHGIEQSGVYYNQTENMADGGAPNFGFDVGRGSHAVSFSGLGGVKVPAAFGGLGHGTQDPAYGPGDTLPTLGFVTFDNKPNQSAAGVGSSRVTWISVDLAQLAGSPPADGVTESNGKVRLPVEVDGFPQPMTKRLFPVFVHTTANAPSGWPHPYLGFPAFTNSIAGGSAQLPLGHFLPLIPSNVGVPVALQYGSSGKDPTGHGRLIFDPKKADISGRKELYILP